MGRISEHRRRRSASKPGHMGLVMENWTFRDVPETRVTDPRLVELRIVKSPFAGARDQTYITWPYPPATFQEQNMNGWIGNQLPGTHKKPWQSGYNFSWQLPTYQPQNHQAYARGSSFGKQMGQVTSSNVLQAISSAWQNVRGGTS